MTSFRVNYHWSPGKPLAELLGVLLVWALVLFYFAWVAACTVVVFASPFVFIAWMLGVLS